MATAAGATRETELAAALARVAVETVAAMWVVVRAAESTAATVDKMEVPRVAKAVSQVDEVEDS